MDSSTGQPTLHPVLACAATVREAVKDASGCDPVFITTADKETALVELARAGDALDALRLTVLAAAESLGDVAEDTHARTAGEWASRATGRDPGAGRGDARFAKDLAALPALKAAVDQQTVSLAQARVIIGAIRDLDRHAPDLAPEVRAEAVEHLIKAAGTYGPRELRILGGKILDVINPAVAEDYERRRLEAEEAHARRVTYLSMRRRGDGTTDLRGRISDLLAARLKRYLAAYTNPRRTEGPDNPFQADQTGQGPEPGQPDQGSEAAAAGFSAPTYPEKQGQALQALLESLDPLRLPLHSGDATRVVVTISLDALRDRLRAAGLLGEDPITAGEVRRLACQAGIIPAVLGGDSEVLDLGRTQRLFNPAQRRAGAIRHPHCQADGCTIPAEWCEAHHRDPWSEGGSTDHHDLVLLCSRHHHAHLPTIRTDYTGCDPGGDGTVRFHRRT